MDTSDEDITFDEKGVCNHCIKYEKDEEIRKAEAWNLPLVYDKIRKDGMGEKYDVLLGLSGGADSSLCLHYLCANDIRPLTFSIDNGWNTKGSDENIMKLVEGLKVPFYRFTIDISKFRELQSAFIKSGTKNIEIPSDHLIIATAYQLANKYKIKWIISGGNLATESIMPKSWGYNARDLVFIKAIYKQFTDKKLVGLPIMGLIKYIYYRFVKRIKVINLLDYYVYNREEAKKLLNKKYGWRDYGGKHCESSFTWWFQNFYLFTKFNIDKRRAHLSSMILSGQLTRQEAMKILAERPVYPELGLERQILKKYPKHEYTEYPNSEWLWNLLSKIYAHCK